MTSKKSISSVWLDPLFSDIITKSKKKQFCSLLYLMLQGDLFEQYEKNGLKKLYSRKETSNKSYI